MSRAELQRATPADGADRPLPQPGPRSAHGRQLVVVDFRAPEQLTIDLRADTAEVPWLSADEGLPGASRWQKTAKRLLDIVLGVLALSVLSPVLIVTALVVKLCSPGPVFYVQDRAGRLGEPFRCMKFRTMCVDAEAKRHELNGLNEVDGPVFKIRCDPRTTPVGRFLRKSSIDELPQLLHVLSGKMSLVGPRPLPVEEAAALTDWQAQRLLAKPGLTGIWQVSGRSDLDFHTWAQMDIEYIGDWSLWLDLKLLLRTVPAVLSGRGAY